MADDKSIPKNKPFSLYDTNEISQWLNEKGFHSETIELITNNGLTGYDLIAFTDEDFKQLNIPIQHEYYLLLKEIQESLFNDLKISITYEGKSFTFELENDQLYTIEALSAIVAEVFQIQSKIFLTTEENDILMPNLKIIQRMLSNPKKYGKLLVVKMNQSQSKKDKGYSSMANYTSQQKELDLKPLKPSNAKDIEYHSKTTTDPYPYQPLPNKDLQFNSFGEGLNQQEVTQDKPEGEYSSQNQGLSSMNYQSYVGKTDERDSKDVMYSFNPQDNLIDQDPQNKAKDKIKDEPYQSNFNVNLKDKDRDSKPKAVDLNNYKKLYGNYEKNDINIEDNADDTHQLLQEKEVKRVSSEERNYRLQNLTNENKLDEYQPKQYDKYSSSVTYSSMDKFNRFSSRQPQPGSITTSGAYTSGFPSVNRQEANTETGYSSLNYQSKLTPPPKKDNENTGAGTGTGTGTGYSSSFDLRNKVNDLRSQISNYTRDQKMPQDNKTNMFDYSKLRSNAQKPNSSTDYTKGSYF